MNGGYYDQWFNKGMEADEFADVVSKMQPAQAAPVDTSPTDAQKASKLATQGGMMSANPYLAAAGLGLGVLADAQADKRQRVMQMMGSLGQGFGGI